MRKTICLLFVFLLLLCGCSPKEQTDKSSQLNIGSFSYEEDSAYYKDDPGVKLSGFINTDKTDVIDTEHAVELAKKECTVDYDTISVAFDEDSKMYRVSFYKMDCDGGDQNVYINQEGITKLIIYGE